jgi:hypothetical protein
VAIPATSFAAASVRTSIGRIHTRDEWEQFRRYYFRYLTKNNENIARGLDDSMPSEVHLLSPKPLSEQRRRVMFDLPHAWHHGYESAKGN